MLLRVPMYYKEFRCIADKCQDSCCIGWEIDIDEDTFDYYKSVEGEFGTRLRTHMVSEDVNSFVLEKNGWCPFLNEKKLCDIRLLGRSDHKPSREYGRRVYTEAFKVCVL